jgi:Cu+-exporting ATPase
MAVRMHREISHTDGAFDRDRNLSLYLLTALLGLLIALDVWPRLVAWLGWSGLPAWPPEVFGYRYALIAAVIGGARVLYTSLQALFEGKVGADLALAIACLAAILLNEPLVAAEVVFIGCLGECLESFTFERTRRAIRKIVEVFPRRCWLLRDGTEVRVFTHELQVGDRVVVKPGGRVPVDGLVVDGRSAVDMSALTGESLPVDRGPGDEILAGSLNQFGALTIEAQRVAEHTVAGRVIELTAKALRDKPALERTADRLARYFLPAVLALAALTLLAGMIFHGMTLFRPAGAVRPGLGTVLRLSVYPALSVLVVACPCALILATPAAIIAALGRLAGTGVLIKGGSALERLASVTAIAFDKTGTLTEGRLELGDVIPLEGVSADELLRIAASAEQRSEHVLAQLVLQEAAARHLALDPVEDFQAHPGAGVTARTVGGTVVVGTRRLLEEKGISLSPQANARLGELDAAGQTALLVARDGLVLGMLGARDRVRPEARQALVELRALGICDMVLLTGDRAATARTVAEEVGIENVHAELLPQQKAEFIAHLKGGEAASARRQVAMMGDGINDAPALASADVGLAVGSGADVAAEAGDVVFLGDPLRSLPLLARLSRETVRIIRQNIVIFAFGVNALGILLTAWLWPILAPAEWYEQSPVVAVIYHQLGSLAVLLNSMRLLWFERSGLANVRGAMSRVDHWMEHHLDPGEFFHWLSHHWGRVALGGAVLAGILYALSGLTQVNADEMAVVSRFGLPVEDLGPGLSWRWPWPVEDVIRVQPDRIRTVEVGFRSRKPAGTTAPLSWASTHGNDGIDRVESEAVMMTGDGNLVELQATVRYTVASPHTYLFQVREPDEVIRAAAESVLRAMIAGRPFQDLLTVHRQAFQREALARLEVRCQEYGAGGLGIRFEDLSLHDLHPPREVVQAYYEVTKAMEQHDRLINQAQADSLSKVRGAEADQQRIIREAQATRTEKVTQAQAEQTRFLTLSTARKQLAFDQEWRLFLDACAALQSGTPAADVYAAYERRRQDALTLQATLTDFRLFWDALGRALTGRDMVLIDADRVPGRRHLMLFDPEQFRVPAPAVMPSNREKARD